MTLSRLRQLINYPNAVPIYYVEAGTVVKCLHWELKRVMEDLSDAKTVRSSQLTAPGSKKVIVIPYREEVRNG